MIISIDTSGYESVSIAISEGKREIATRSVEAAHAQAEKLLPLLESILKKTGHSLGDIDKIEVENRGEGFTSLRIGVVTANALAYALEIPVMPKEGKPLKKKGITAVAPAYSRPPSITKNNGL